MPVYPGDSLVNIDTPVALANGDAANVSRLRLGAHTGTHVDAPPIDPGPGMPLPDRLLPARMIKRRSSSSTSDLSLGVALAKYLFR